MKADRQERKSNWKIDKTAVMLWVIFAVPLVVFAIAVVAELME